MKVRKKGKFLKWLKERRKIIITIAIIWLIIIAINYYIGSTQNKDEYIAKKPITKYEPHTPAISSKYKVDESDEGKVEEKIDAFMNSCNNKEYENVYNMLTDGCKEVVFNNDIELLKLYIDNLFTEPKIYDILNYSNDEDKYIYRLRIFDDYYSKGINSLKDLKYNIQELILVKANNDLKISMLDFIEKKDVNKQFLDDNLSIDVKNVEVYYDREIYTVEVSNLTGSTLVLCNNMLDEEILLSTTSDSKEIYNQDIVPSETNITVVLKPYESATYKMKFIKFFDEYVDSKSILFSKIRLYNNYQIDKQTSELIEEPLNQYSAEVKF